MSGMTTQSQEGKPKINPGALFLVDLLPVNMFEKRGGMRGVPAKYRCKVCDLDVPVEQHARHHKQHRKDKAQHATEQIRARKEQRDMATEKKATPKAQGFPAVYLNDDGSKFKPGGDAQAKSDAVKTILYHEDGHTDIDLSARKADLTLQQAKELLAVRGWNAWVIKARKNLEAKIARAAVKAAEKKAKVKDEVAAKREAKAAEGEVTPDPKPAKKAPKRGGRRVGA